MKLERLRLENINSLYGRWCIDFTAPEYLADGIFAITGPTGSGKSTILDAVCLALYGRTPRLPVISRSSNELMSRQRGDCFAEVLFRTEGGLYRVHWSQHRSRGRADGNLMQAKHELSDETSGELLSSSLRETSRLVPQITGMTFEQFTRSMLLAQGGFAAFLAASSDERAPILEQLTGTQIYSEISQRVHTRLRSEKDKRDLLTAALSGVRLPDRDQQHALYQEIWVCRNERVACRAALLRYEKLLRWFEQEEQLILRKSEASAGLERIAGLAQQREQERERLRLARAANSCEGLYLLYEDLKKRRNQQAEELEKLFDRREAAQQEAEEQRTALQEAELYARQESESIAAQTGNLKSIRVLDVKIDQLDEQIALLAQKRKKQSDQADEQENELSDLETDIERKESSLGQAREYLNSHAAEKSLAADMVMLDERMGRFSSLQEELEDSSAEKQEKLSEYGEQEAALGKTEEAVETAGKRLDELAAAYREKKAGIAKVCDGAAVSELEDELAAAREQMETERLTVRLEDERMRLTEGQPCPLCGALHHPYTEELPRKDMPAEEAFTRLHERIDQVHRLEEEMRQLGDEQHAAELAREKASSAAAAGRSRLEMIGRDLERFGRDEKRLTDAIEKLRSDLSGRLEMLGMDTEVAPESLGDIRSELSRRSEKWSEAESAVEGGRKEIDSLKSRRDTVAGLLKYSLRMEKESEGELEQLQETRKTLAAERSELLGEFRDALQFSEELETRRQAAAERLETTRKANETAQRVLEHTDEKIAEGGRLLGELGESLAAAEKKLTRALQDSGLSDLEQFLSCRLEREETEQLAGYLDGIDAEEQAFGRELEQVEHRLAELHRMESAPGDRSRITAAKQSAQQELDRLIARSGSLDQQMADIRRAQLQADELAGEIEEQQRVIGQWEQLHGLIGSSDGKKYRNFAQGLAFEMVIAQANRQLAGLTDRYLLLRDSEQRLELNIMDIYQAGEIRSTKNLSGGESFLVSLALALGLSHLAGRQVQVDSLFLDEGFGTLDEEALEHALEALAGLQEQGKMIGIISHVGAIKERIPTQINLIPRSGGQSLMRGPGVSRGEEPG